MDGIEERALTGEEVEQLRADEAAGLAELGFHPDVAPLAIVYAVSRFVDDWRGRRDVRRTVRLPRSSPARERRISSSGPDENAVVERLAAVWGAQVVRAAGWEWAHLHNRPLAIVSPGREYAVFPTGLFTSLLYRGSWGWEENSVVALFRRIEAGDLPPAAPRRYEVVG